MAWCKYKETKLKVYSRDQYDIIELSNNALCGWEIKLKDGSDTIVTNLSLMDSKEIEKIEDKKLFLVDENDFDAYYTMHEKNVPVEEISSVFSTLKKCSKHHHKNIYMRVMPVPLANIQEKKEANEEHAKVTIKRGEGRVFVEDVMAVIPLLLSRQQKNAKWIDKKLKTYYNQWQSGHEHVDSAINITQFLAVLEELDCDKTQITLIDDPIYEITKNEVVDEFGFVRTCAPNLRSVMDGAQSMFFVFHYLVNGINWRNETCTDHEQCGKKLLKPRIMNLFYHIGSFGDGCYFSVTYLLAEIEKIRDLCPAKYRAQRETNDYIMQGIRGGSHTHAELYYRAALEHNLILLDVGLTNENVKFIQVFSFRFLLQFGWIVQFFTENEDTSLRLCLVHSSLTLIPEKLWPKGMEMAYDILNKTKMAWDKWRERGETEETEESLMGAFPGAPPSLRPEDRPPPGAPPALFAPAKCCTICQDILKKTGKIQMDALVVFQTCVSYETDLQKMPSLVAFKEKNAKTIAELKQKIAEKERNKKPTSIELKSRNEQLIKAFAVAKQRTEAFTAEKRILIDTSNNLKKTTEELMARKENLQSEVNSRKENEPTEESVKIQVPIEAQEKEKRIAELQNAKRDLLTTIESRSIYIKDMTQ